MINNDKKNDHLNHTDDQNNEFISNNNNVVNQNISEEKTKKNNKTTFKNSINNNNNTNNSNYYYYSSTQTMPAHNSNEINNNWSNNPIQPLYINTYPQVFNYNIPHYDYLHNWQNYANFFPNNNYYYQANNQNIYSDPLNNTNNNQDNSINQKLNNSYHVEYQTSYFNSPSILNSLNRQNKNDYRNSSKKFNSKNKINNELTSNTLESSFNFVSKPEEKIESENNKNNENDSNISANFENKNTIKTKYFYNNQKNQNLKYKGYMTPNYVNILTTEFQAFKLVPNNIYSPYKFRSNLNIFNPKDFLYNGEKEGLKNSKFFVIKSYSKEDVIHSIKHGIWCSTENGNKKLNQAFLESLENEHMSIYLFFSINSSGHFCGLAEMMSRVDFESKSNVWAQDKWKGKFEVKWIFVKDVPNSKLRHILLPNNENKSVANSRDAQEILFEQAIQVLKIFRSFNHKSTILDEVDLEFANLKEEKNLNIKNDLDLKEKEESVLNKETSNEEINEN